MCYGVFENHGRKYMKFLFHVPFFFLDKPRYTNKILHTFKLTRIPI